MMTSNSTSPPKKDSTTTRLINLKRRQISLQIYSDGLCLAKDFFRISENSKIYTDVSLDNFDLFAQQIPSTMDEMSLVLNCKLPISYFRVSSPFWKISGQRELTSRGIIGETVRLVGQQNEWVGCLIDSNPEYMVVHDAERKTVNIVKAEAIKAIEIKDIPLSQASFFGQNMTLTISPKPGTTITSAEIQKFADSNDIIDMRYKLSGLSYIVKHTIDIVSHDVSKKTVYADFRSEAIISNNTGLDLSPTTIELVELNKEQKDDPKHGRITKRDVKLNPEDPIVLTDGLKTQIILHNSQTIPILFCFIYDAFEFPKTLEKSYQTLLNVSTYQDTKCMLEWQKNHFSPESVLSGNVIVNYFLNGNDFVPVNLNPIEFKTTLSPVNNDKVRFSLGFNSAVKCREYIERKIVDMSSEKETFRIRVETMVFYTKYSPLFCSYNLKFNKLPSNFKIVGLYSAEVSELEKSIKENSEDIQMVAKGFSLPEKFNQYTEKKPLWVKYDPKYIIVHQDKPDINNNYTTSVSFLFQISSLNDKLPLDKHPSLLVMYYEMEQKIK